MMAETSLREIEANDLAIFFEQQRDPDAIRMAAFPPRDRDAFMAHWANILADGTTILKTIVFHGNVAGNIVCWEQSGERRVGYWLGKDYWGKGIASAALSQFLTLVDARPLYARVAKHNLASLRVLQKCRFTVCGEDKFSWPDGEEGEEFILILRAQERSGLADDTTISSSKA